MIKAWNQKVNELGLLPWITWFVAALFYLYEYFLQVSPNVMTHDLMSAFQINGTYLGYLGGVYFISYAAMQIPVGLLLDYIGPRKALTIATFVCMVGCFLFGMTHSFVQALLARFFLGFGSAFAIVSCLKIVASWFPLNRFAVLSGLTVTMGTLGGVIGQAPLALLVDKISWRPTMMILAVASGILMFLVILVVRDKPEDETIHPPYETDQPKSGILSGLFKIMKNRQCWLVAVYGGLMFMPTTILGTLWGASYISTAYAIERHVAAGYISMMFFGWLVGSPMFGLISDRLGLRKPPMYVGSIGALVCLTTILYLHPPVSWLGVFFFAFGIFSSGFLPSFSIILEINQQKENATALGFMNTLNMIGPVLLQPLIGFMLDLGWNGQLQEGVRIYSVSNYHVALIMLPVCVFVSIILLPFIEETFCHRKLIVEPDVVEGTPAVNAAN